MEREKAIGLFRLRLNGIFAPFHMYGMDTNVPPAQEEILKQALVLHMRLNGNDPVEGQDRPIITTNNRSIFDD
jgi:hypothetical protein